MFSQGYDYIILATEERPIESMYEEKEYMLFNSYVFVFLFLPICILGYFTFNRVGQDRLAKLFLLAMSLWFYGFFHYEYLFIIIISIIANYIFAAAMKRLSGHAKRGKTHLKLLLAAALLFNLGILFYFKYYDFFIENINLAFGSDLALTGVLLPLGISFFTFQQISYVIDSYRGEVAPYRSLDYALYVSFFPQLIAGPIVTHDELVPQFLDASRKRFNWENFSQGIYIFALGLAKKVLLADTFGNAANAGFGNIPNLNSTDALITMLSYTLQIYLDFSGYCDMAVGIARMLNIDLPLNFNSPYKALTITEFWDRWHMTLTRFFTKYVYIPLGGNRKGNVRTYLNVMIVFLLSGLWHGANWTFLLWGACHGIFTVFTRVFRKFFDALHPALNWMITFSFLNVTWTFFRADTVRDAFDLLLRIARLDFGPINSATVSSFNLTEFNLVTNYIDFFGRHPGIIVILFLVITIALMLGSKNAYEKMQVLKPAIPRMVITALLLTWCIFSFSGVNTFLYFNF